MEQKQQECLSIADRSGVGREADGRDVAFASSQTVTYIMTMRKFVHFASEEIRLIK